MARALDGLRRYQDAPRPAPPEAMPAIAEVMGATLRDYGGTGLPVLFVPSLINPPGILDLSVERSLLRWLRTQGFHPLLVDWGWDVEARKQLSIAGHVEQILLPMIDALGEPPALVGYCLGGTMAIAAAALSPSPRLATIAAPWHFSAFPAEDRALLARLWTGTEPATRSLGLLPMEALQSAFWSLDPARTVMKFEKFAGMEPGSAAASGFVALEDWANDGPPMGEAAAREMFDGLFAADLPGTGAWTVSGRAVSPEALPCPLLSIVSTSDRIVPAATSVRSGERLELAQGHVGMVIGGRARAALWEPLAAWLSQGRLG